MVESIYEKSLAIELERQGIPFKRQMELELSYKGVSLGEDFRLDLIVGDKVVVELKVVKELAPIHEAQLLTYMKLTGCRVGLLLNFNVPVLRQGIKRLVLQCSVSQCLRGKKESIRYEKNTVLRDE